MYLEEKKIGYAQRKFGEQFLSGFLEFPRFHRRMAKLTSNIWRRGGIVLPFSRSCHDQKWKLEKTNTNSEISIKIRFERYATWLCWINFRNSPRMSRYKTAYVAFSVTWDENNMFQYDLRKCRFLSHKKRLGHENFKAHSPLLGVYYDIRYFWKYNYYYWSMCSKVKVNQIMRSTKLTSKPCGMMGVRARNYFKYFKWVRKYFNGARLYCKWMRKYF